MFARLSASAALARGVGVGQRALGISRRAASSNAGRLERSRAPKTQTTYKKPFSARKQYLFGEYDRSFAQSPGVIVVQHYNLSGSEQLEQRQALKLAAHGARLMVVRAKMVKAVLRDTRYANLEPLFTGPSAIIYWDRVDEPLAAMRLALQAIEKQKKTVVMGACVGDVLLNPAMLKDFVALPPIDHLRAQLVGVLQTPAQRLAAVLARTPQRLVDVLKQKAES
ncbi:hypothetical protein H4R18_002419 [Coemansia javaensis]|uniref:Ribosomal protein L10 n=1 Tax=Coemansia javaensis TaxID=2761396 RepID=A0A9W8HD17_9FUNG|nr:hypothetical protein H4R18_002419 [Coemansia javaensis]